MTTHVLVLCTHNSARSVLAERMLDHWARRLGRDVRAHSAGSAPSGRVNPFAIEVLERAGVEVEPELEPTIAVIEDPAARLSGGLWLRGGIPVTSEDGTLYPVRNRMALCRCGESKNKPFCDGTHAVVKFADEALASYDATPAGSDTITVPTA